MGKKAQQHLERETQDIHLRLFYSLPDDVKTNTRPLTLPTNGDYDCRTGTLRFRPAVRPLGDEHRDWLLKSVGMEMVICLLP